MSYSKETFKRKSKNDLYLIRWHYNLETHYVAVTNDLDKWLEQNNAQRDDDVLDEYGEIDEQNQETLEMFDIEQIETHLFEEIK